MISSSDHNVAEQSERSESVPANHDVTPTSVNPVLPGHDDDAEAIERQVGGTHSCIHFESPENNEDTTADNATTSLGGAEHNDPPTSSNNAPSPRRFLASIFGRTWRRRRAPTADSRRRRPSRETHRSTDATNQSSSFRQVVQHIFCASFDSAKFVFYFTLLTFSVLFSLRWDGLLVDVSWWIIFMPIWLWNVYAISSISLNAYSSLQIFTALRQQFNAYQVSSSTSGVNVNRNSTSSSELLNTHCCSITKTHLISLCNHLLIFISQLFIVDNLTASYPPQHSSSTMYHHFNTVLGSDNSHFQYSSSSSSPSAAVQYTVATATTSTNNKGQQQHDEDGSRHDNSIGYSPRDFLYKHDRSNQGESSRSSVVQSDMTNIPTNVSSTYETTNDVDVVRQTTRRFGLASWNGNYSSDNPSPPTSASLVGSSSEMNNFISSSGTSEGTLSATSFDTTSNFGKDDHVVGWLHPWSFVFTPLFILSFVVFVVWIRNHLLLVRFSCCDQACCPFSCCCCGRGRSDTEGNDNTPPPHRRPSLFYVYQNLIRLSDVEYFFALNLFQFIFLVLKLDGMLPHMTWEITFIPSWVGFCVTLLLAVYSSIVRGIAMRNQISTSSGHHNSSSSSWFLMTTGQQTANPSTSSGDSLFGHMLQIVPMLLFLVLLSNKLDMTIDISYLSTFLPLHFTLLTLLLTSCSSSNSNPPSFMSTNGGAEMAHQQTPPSSVAASFPLSVASASFSSSRSGRRRRRRGHRQNSQHREEEEEGPRNDNNTIHEGDLQNNNTDALDYPSPSQHGGVSSPAADESHHYYNYYYNNYYDPTFPHYPTSTGVGGGGHLFIDPTTYYSRRGRHVVLNAHSSSTAPFSPPSLDCILHCLLSWCCVCTCSRLAVNTSVDFSSPDVLSSYPAAVTCCFGGGPNSPSDEEAGEALEDKQDDDEVFDNFSPSVIVSNCCCGSTTRGSTPSSSIACPSKNHCCMDYHLCNSKLMYSLDQPD